MASRQVIIEATVRDLLIRARIIELRRLAEKTARDYERPDAPSIQMVQRE
jgi:hypothetical protein